MVPYKLNRRELRVSTTGFAMLAVLVGSAACNDTLNDKQSTCTSAATTETPNEQTHSWEVATCEMSGPANDDTSIQDTSEMDTSNIGNIHPDAQATILIAPLDSTTPK